jgi:hypothetical protein
LPSDSLPTTIGATMKYPRTMSDSATRPSMETQSRLKQPQQITCLTTRASALTASEDSTEVDQPSESHRVQNHSSVPTAAPSCRHNSNQIMVPHLFEHQAGTAPLDRNDSALQLPYCTNWVAPRSVYIVNPSAAKLCQRVEEKSRRNLSLRAGTEQIHHRFVTSCRSSLIATNLCEDGHSFQSVICRPSCTNSFSEHIIIAQHLKLNASADNEAVRSTVRIHFSSCQAIACDSAQRSNSSQACHLAAIVTTTRETSCQTVNKRILPSQSVTCSSIAVEDAYSSSPAPSQMDMKPMSPVLRNCISRPLYYFTRQQKHHAHHGKTCWLTIVLSTQTSVMQLGS